MSPGAAAGPTAAGQPSVRSPLGRLLFDHTIDEYPTGRRRMGYLGLTVLATVALYYVYYTQTGVTPNILAGFHMSFAFYIGIIAWESVTMLLCWWAGVRLLKSYRADGAQFAAAQNVTVIALTTSLLMWLVAFLDVGGEWFLMWQSKLWNGQEAAFRMFTVVGVVFLVVVQREPTPD